jgi:hypothetical protein
LLFKFKRKSLPLIKNDPKIITNDTDSNIFLSFNSKNSPKEVL